MNDNCTNHKTDRFEPRAVEKAARSAAEIVEFGILLLIFVLIALRGGLWVLFFALVMARPEPTL